ncbi:hypothetical protein DBV39_05580 [Orrella marina]|uniref:Uncharacterized protein n=1 Tax=Orrella marina TaxID=2163011 RepID=A0A2R4XHN4_9BURK|nr:hypothetical protein DBV39_05580 [Orrella marina]
MQIKMISDEHNAIERNRKQETLNKGVRTRFRLEKNPLRTSLHCGPCQMIRDNQHASLAQTITHTVKSLSEVL